MRKTKRSAFTIVELVIVIAVIAILSAVLIPTFGAIIKNANVASDQATAATLTSELHVYLKGETIDSEEELMDVLSDAKSGIGKKLVPKALNYGHHFWFDMENQMIVAGYAEDIEKIGKEETPTAKSEQEDGIVLTSAVLTADVTVESSFGGLRNLFPHNDYYLITAESALSSIFGDMSAIENAQEYLAFVTDLSDATEDEVFGNIATYVLNNVKKTVIINSYGMFHYAGITDANVYFAPGIQVVKANRYVYDEALNGASDADENDAVPAIAGNEINLPSSVLLVEANALDLGSSVVIKTNCADYNAIASIFAPKSTDAVIADKFNNQYIITVGPEDGDANKADTDVLHTKAGVWKCNLVPKAPFETWSIAYGLTDNTQKTENSSNNNWYYYNNTDKILYVAYAASTEFYIESSTGTRSDAVKKWTSSNHEVMTDDLAIVGGGETTLTATVKDLYGKETTQEIVVRVNTASQVNVTVESSTFNLDGTSTHNVNWYYNGTNPVAPSVYGNITYNYNFAKGSETLSLEIVEETTDESGAKIGSLLKKSTDGTKVERTALLTGDTKFTISVDGALTTTFDINIIDNSASPLQVNFHDKTEDEVYKYYIGDDNGITLGALFGFKSSAINLEGATLNIYDSFDADQKTTHINGLSAGVNATFGTPASNGVESTIRSDHSAVTIDGITVMDYDNPWTLSSDWTNQVIEFTGLGSNATSNVWIQISPINHPAIFIKFTLVDATNVEYTLSGTTDVTAGEINAALGTTGVNGVVVHHDFAVNTGTTINVGAKKLYGNGYKIDARTYVANRVVDQNNQPISATEIIYENVAQKYGGLQKGYCYDCGGVYKEIMGINKHWGHNTSNYEPVEVTNPCYETDAALITIDGGILDNIYVNGPVYPNLQYDADDCIDTTHTDDHVHTQFFTSGIKATGDSTISNSYIKGFRQPVQVSIGEGSQTVGVSLRNVTLEGGNYANLNMLSGILNLHDVTTIQNHDGYEATIENEAGAKPYVIGLGIMIEDSAVANDALSNINVSGYLDQYNWISTTSTATFPVVNGMDMRDVLGMLLDGVSVEIRIGFSMDASIPLTTVEKDINFIDSYIHPVQEGNTTVNYLNTGFMFISMGSVEDTTVVAGNRRNITVTEATGDNRYSSKYLTKRALAPHYSIPQFSGYGLAGGMVTAAQLTGLLPYIDDQGRVLVAQDLFDAIEEDPTDLVVNLWSYSNGDSDLSDDVYDGVVLGLSGYPISYPSTAYYARIYGN